MTQDWEPDPERREDGPDALREWRWRSYTDYLADLGYDLDGGGEPDHVARPEAPSPGSRVLRNGRQG